VAIMADWFFGKYRVILFVSMLYTIGHFVLSISGSSYTIFSTGLIIIACCAGGIKSCVSANVGDQFDKSNEHLLSKAYGWFYMSINLGGTLAPLFIPLLKKYYGPEIAFGVPGILMALATIVFWMGRKKYKRVPSRQVSKKRIFLPFLILCPGKTFQPQTRAKSMGSGWRKIFCKIYRWH
jgi:POT family proton-dependent oligopeptide transporter